MNAPLSGSFANGDVSYWYRALGVPEPAHRLDGDLRADVAIIGGGYTGLWTAYYLIKADPTLHVVVLEKEFAGFGASGRNGGWLAGLLPGSPRRYAKTHGADAARALPAGAVHHRRRGHRRVRGRGHRGRHRQGRRLQRGQDPRPGAPPGTGGRGAARLGLGPQGRGGRAGERAHPGRGGPDGVLEPSLRQDPARETGQRAGESRTGPGGRALRGHRGDRRSRPAG